MRAIPTLALVAALLGAASARADESPAAASPPWRPYYVGASLFTLANLAPSDHPPVFVQLNLGYRLTPRDRLSVEAITWRYYAPLGIPWWESSAPSSAGSYPGHVREYGVGLAYQRWLWEGLFTSIGAIPFLRQYHDVRGQRIGSGFELFLTLRLGYHLLLVNRVFLEPSVAFNCWPITTHVPDGFATKDERWPSYYLLEPGFHVGIVF